MAKISPPILLVVDGSSLLHRAYHALPNLTAPDGRLVNACYGFLTMFLKALAELKPTHAAVTFDRPEPTFRKEFFPTYQAQREEKPDELYAQIPMIKDILAALRVPVHEVAGFEADDVIGTIVEEVRSKKSKVRSIKSKRMANAIVLTGDKDLLQLVGDGVEVVLFRRGMTETGRYDRAAVIERFGFGPERIPDFKALAGDPSDNYPGVPGIGEKTATELVKEFGSIKQLLQAAKDGFSPSRRKGERAPGEALAKTGEGVGKRVLTDKLAMKIRDHAADLKLGLKLATIVRNVPVEFDFAACARGVYDRDAVVAKLRELGFQSLVSRLPEQHPLRVRGAWGVTNPPVTPPNFPLHQGEGERRGGVASPLAGGRVGSLLRSPEPITQEGQNELDQKTTIVENWSSHPVEMLSEAAAIRAVLADACTASAVALSVVSDEDDLRRGHPRALGLAFGERVFGIQPWGIALAESATLLRNAAVAKDAHDMKSFLHALGRSRIELAGLRSDTGLLSYLLSPGSRSHDLAHVAFAELGVELPPGVILSTAKDPAQQKYRDASGDALSMTLEGDGQRAAAERAGREAVVVQKLVPILTAKVRDASLTHVYEDIERPLVPVLFRMEAHGIQLDTDHLASLGKRMRHELDVADRTIYRHAGEEFNIDSSQQLKRILFEKLGLAVRGIKKTAKGKTLSTAASELEKLRGAHPIIEHLFTHRELSKLLSTYVEALPTLADPTTGRVHTTYHQTVTATGRLSSSGPNLQNIPVAEPWGPAIRKAFIAEDGWRLLSLDYSQFELRVAAALSGDRALQKAFRSKRDIHAATGAEIFGVIPGEVTRDQRRVAKAINFGILYGMGASALAQTAEISREEAEEYIRRYFQAYLELAEWVEATKALARKRGYVETLFGRKRFLPEIASGVPQVRAAAERMAVNMPIQGTQADLLKMAMIRADEWIRTVNQESGTRNQESRERVRMVLTVHDELVFEAREKFVAEAAKALIDILEHVHQLPVPIVVEAKAGPSWGELVPVNQ